MVRLINFLRFIQLSTWAMRQFIPWVRRMTMHMASYIFVTVITFWGGVPSKVDAIANEWLDRAHLAGFPGDQLPRLYWVFYVLAFGMIVLGWIGMSFLTVFIIHLLP
jgi:hypothetical protein